MTELLTATRARTFLTCPRKHHYAYNLGWRPAEKSDALRFGTMWHEVLEVYWRDGEKEAWRAIVQAAGDAFEIAKAQSMFRVYAERWAHLREQYRVLGVEVQFETDLINPATWRKSRTWRLAGKIDALVEDDMGRVWVVEHKTTSEDCGPGARYRERLDLDHQISGYMIGAYALGYTPAGVIYDIARKPALRPLLATPEDSRRYTKDGRLYSSQREKDERPEEYLLRTYAHLRARPAEHFAVIEVRRSEADLQDYMGDVWALAKAMRAGLRVKNSAACHRFGRCPYWGVCAYDAPLEAPDFQLVGAHPELITMGGR